LVNDVLVKATPLLDEMLFQVVDVTNPATVDVLLEHALHFIVHGQGYWVATATVI